ncbi:MAG: M23 family metallopeptidase [Sporocytophaga sp.]|uniref:M23 family metallopeptidase n=1 Tax=Sporocytophaga sp. TaxID=2231183 RepID=UPI001B019E6C|nr:M23 family metallopeptidase [Sporocytophaga sp.]MBO9699952.1 M23 family metallopeptidase [Sporocytophaga sp.]
MAKILVVIFEQASHSVEIEFPLKNGLYLITDGGNSKTSRLMNYHYFSPTHKRNKTNRSMLYATDVVKLSKNQKHFLPSQNSDYPIFGESVYSPMGGTVFKVVDGVFDNEPYSGNYPYNTGNTIVVRQNNYYFLLGHLKFNSIKVKEGDKVHKGQVIAEIGNSGWTERPHLHMQLMESDNENYWYGLGIPIKFNKKNLYKNRLVKV